MTETKDLPHGATQSGPHLSAPSTTERLRSAQGRRYILASLLVALSAACAHPKQNGDGDAGTSAATAATTAASAAPSVVAPLNAAAIYGPKLAMEAQGRPDGTPKAEDVFSAIVAAGVPLAAQEQHVASTVLAHFCLGARSAEGLAMSACEYDTNAAALAGRDLSAKTFAKIEHRDITVNKKTTLTILESPFTPQSQAAHDKAVAAFLKL